MQLLLIVGITFAIGAVTFALQNNVPVTVSLASWHYDSSLAVVLLAALGLGALIAGLVSTPSVIKGQWTASRLRRQIVILEDHQASLESRIHDLESTLPPGSPAPVPATEEAAPYVDMRALLAAQDN
jgi:lipopolysaccharide assembly protein A